MNIESNKVSNLHESPQLSGIICYVPFINSITNLDCFIGMKQLPNECIDLVVTDPPYGMNFQSNYRAVKHKNIQNDNNLDWLNDWLIDLKRVTKKDAHLYIFCSWHKVEIFKSEISKYFTIKNLLIWEKNNTGMGDLQGDFAPKYEMIIFCSNGTKKLNGSRDANILKAKRTKNDNHPTEKPVNLIAYLIEKSSKKGDLVLDTFAGSFSTAQACKLTGRNFISFEIENEYCKTAKSLIENQMVSFF